jgi:hypothetical protein
VQFAGAVKFTGAGTRTVLTGDPRAQNNQASPRTIMPETAPFTAAQSFSYEAPANSLTMFRFKTEK